MAPMSSKNAPEVGIILLILCPKSPPHTSPAPCLKKPVPLALLDAGAGPRTLLHQQDSCGGQRLPCVCTALCMHCLVGTVPTLAPHIVHLGLLRSTPWGQPPYPPLKNNKAPTVATDRLVCVPPCVCTANPSHTHSGSWRSKDALPIHTFPPTTPHPHPHTSPTHTPTPPTHTSKVWGGGGATSCDIWLQQASKQQANTAQSSLLHQRTVSQSNHCFCILVGV